MNALARQQLRPDEPLPTIHQLARELDVNPNTVARAYRELEQAGHVVGQRGRGTFPVPLAAAKAKGTRPRVRAAQDRRPRPGGVCAPGLHRRRTGLGVQEADAMTQAAVAVKEHWTTFWALVAASAAPSGSSGGWRCFRWCGPGHRRPTSDWRPVDDPVLPARRTMPERPFGASGRGPAPGRSVVPDHRHPDVLVGGVDPAALSALRGRRVSLVGAVASLPPLAGDAGFRARWRHVRSGGRARLSAEAMGVTGRSWRCSVSPGRCCRCLPSRRWRASARHAVTRSAGGATLLGSNWAARRLTTLGMGLLWVPLLAARSGLLWLAGDRNVPGRASQAAIRQRRNTWLWAAFWLLERVYVAAVYCYAVEGVVPASFAGEATRRDFWRAVEADPIAARTGAAPGCRRCAAGSLARNSVRAGGACRECHGRRRGPGRGLPRVGSRIVVWWPPTCFRAGARDRRRRAFPPDPTVSEPQARGARTRTASLAGDGEGPRRRLSLPAARIRACWMTTCGWSKSVRSGPGDSPVKGTGPPSSLPRYACPRWRFGTNAQHRDYASAPCLPRANCCSRRWRCSKSSEEMYR